MQKPPKEKVIVALDVADAATVLHLADALGDDVAYYKIGLQLFTKSGPEIIQKLKQRGLKIFLDLKFHDIPNTVGNAVESACALGADMVTIHLAGGAEMIRAAVSSANRGTLVLGVTVLTSSSHQTLRETGVAEAIEDHVLRLAQLGVKNGVRGFVASPQETAMLRRELENDAVLVVPGVRPEWSQKNDQQRTATPREALAAGADFLVIGRPIIAADDPRAAFHKIVSEL